jgi:uroporphyrinogen-III synthase
VAALREAGLDPAAALAGVSIVAAGEATVRHLANLGLAARAPEGAVGAEAMIAAFASEVRGQEVLVPRAEDGNPALVEGFRRAGARILAVPLYRTVPASKPDAAAAALLREGRIDAIAFGSGSAARGFASLFGPEAIALAAAARTVCMGETCAAAARDAGLRVDAVAGGNFGDLARVLELVVNVR